MTKRSAAAFLREFQNCSQLVYEHVTDAAVRLINRCGGSPFFSVSRRTDFVFLYKVYFAQRLRRQSASVSLLEAVALTSCHTASLKQRPGRDDILIFLFSSGSS